jgi:hypothetical protein
MSAVNQTLVKQRIISRMTQTPFKSKSKLFQKKKLKGEGRLFWPKGTIVN